MREAVIITGASSGIGLAVSERLCDMDYEVFGFGRNFELCKLERGNFHPIICDLLDTAKLTGQVKRIAAEWEIHVLINNAAIRTAARMEPPRRDFTVLGEACLMRRESTG